MLGRLRGKVKPRQAVVRSETPGEEGRSGLSFPGRRPRVRLVAARLRRRLGIGGPFRAALPPRPEHIVVGPAGRVVFGVDGQQRQFFGEDCGHLVHRVQAVARAVSVRVRHCHTAVGNRPAGTPDRYEDAAAAIPVIGDLVAVGRDVLQAMGGSPRYEADVVGQVHVLGLFANEPPPDPGVTPAEDHLVRPRRPAATSSRSARRRRHDAEVPRSLATYDGVALRDQVTGARPMEPEQSRPRGSNPGPTHYATMSRLLGPMRETRSYQRVSSHLDPWSSPRALALGLAAGPGSALITAFQPIRPRLPAQRGSRRKCPRWCSNTRCVCA